MKNPEGLSTARIAMKTILVGSTVLAAFVLLASMVAAPRSASATPAMPEKKASLAATAM